MGSSQKLTVRLKTPNIDEYQNLQSSPITPVKLGTRAIMSQTKSSLKSNLIIDEKRDNSKQTNRRKSTIHPVSSFVEINQHKNIGYPQSEVSPLFKNHLAASTCTPQMIPGERLIFDENNKAIGTLKFPIIQNKRLEKKA